MDAQANVSFIPKRSLTPAPTSSEGVGLLFVIALLIFVVSLVSAGLAFGYEKVITKSIASKSESLKKDQEAIGLSSIDDLVRIDSRIKQSQKLLATHVAPSAILQLLSQETLQSIQFTDFSYQRQTDGSAGIRLSGVADSFSSVALQSDKFGSDKMLKDVLFSDVNTNQNGGVVFTVKMSVVPSLFLYSKTVAASDTNSVQPSASSTQSQ